MVSFENDCIRTIWPDDNDILRPHLGFLNHLLYYFTWMFLSLFSLQTHYANFSAVVILSALFNIIIFECPYLINKFISHSLAPSYRKYLWAKQLSDVTARPIKKKKKKQKRYIPKNKWRSYTQQRSLLPTLLRNK